MVTHKSPTDHIIAVGIVLVVLIPFLRKLITDKAEVTPAEMETTTVVPVA